MRLFQANLNRGLHNIHVWLCANIKLSLNVDKSNLVIFHPPQKKINNDINGKELKRHFCIKYLGVLIDSHLNWKNQVDYIVKKIKRTIGIISKLRYYVNKSILLEHLPSCNNLKTDSKTVRNVVKNEVNLLKNPV